MHVNIVSLVIDVVSKSFWTTMEVDVTDEEASQALASPVLHVR